MAKLGTDAHRFAMEAKYRLLKNDYKGKDKEKPNMYYVNDRQLSEKELEIITQRVKEILASEVFVANPLTKLIIDKDKFSLLDENAKNKYMFELSKIYIEIKNKIV